MRIKALTLGLICLFFIGCLVPAPLTVWKNARRDYLSTHSEISVQMRATIEQGDVLIGMTTDQVFASRGPAYKINRTTGTYGVHEQWVMVMHWPGTYGRSGLDKKAKTYAYIYFENGRVTSWQSR